MNKELLDLINKELDSDITEWSATDNRWESSWDDILKLNRNSPKQYILYVKDLHPKKSEFETDGDSNTTGYVILQSDNGAGRVGTAVDYSQAIKLTDDKEQASTFTNEWINGLISNIKKAANIDVSKASFDKFELAVDSKGSSFADTYKDVWICKYITGGNDWNHFETIVEPGLPTLRTVLGNNFDREDDVWKFYKRAYEQTLSNESNFDWSRLLTERLQILCSDDYSDIYTTDDAADSFLGYFMFNKNLLSVKDFKLIPTVIREYHNAGSLTVRDNFDTVRDWISKDKKNNSKLLVANLVTKSSGFIYSSDDNTYQFNEKGMQIDNPGTCDLRDTLEIEHLFEIVFGGTEKTKPLDLYINDAQYISNDVPLQKGRVEKTFKIDVNEKDVLKLRFDNKNVEIPEDVQTAILSNEKLNSYIEVKDNSLIFKKAYKDNIKLYIGKNQKNVWVLHSVELLGNSEETPKEGSPTPGTPTNDMETSKDVVSEFTALNLLVPQEPDGIPDGDVIKDTTVHVGDIIVAPDGKYYSIMKKNIGNGKRDIKAGTKIYRFRKDVVDKINDLGFSLKPGDFKGKLMDSLITSAPLFDNN